MSFDYIVVVKAVMSFFVELSMLNLYRHVYILWHCQNIHKQFITLYKEELSAILMHCEVLTNFSRN